MSPAPSPAELARCGRLALELAQLAGAEMRAALGQEIDVRYKQGGAAAGVLRDPVSEVDRGVEAMIRARLAAALPDHDVLGEESAERPAPGSPWLWAIDPVDGTANFINGFPLFAGSIGLLHHGVPVLGAVWCASSHALRAGVYHAESGGGLHFEGRPVMTRQNPQVLRRLAGLPEASARSPREWEPRRTGSAAVECAFVAAGLLDLAQFERPNVWDIAGGFALVQAAGGAIRCAGPEGWEDFTRFAAPGEDPAPWRRAVVLGRPEAVEAFCRLRPPPGPAPQRAAVWPPAPGRPDLRPAPPGPQG